MSESSNSRTRKGHRARRTGSAVALAAATALLLGSTAVPALAADHDWIEQTVTLSASPAPGPAETGFVHVLKVGPADAHRVLVLIPGRGEAAGGLRLVAESLARATPGLQVWAVDRREQALADLSGFRGSAARATAYYEGDEYRAQSAAQDGYLADWGLATELNDVRRVVLEAADHGRRSVVLGGHSLGATAVLDYAAWDFDGTPGYRDLAGLVVVDGGVRDALSGAGIDFGLTADQAAAWRAQIAAGQVFDNATSVYTGFGDRPEAAAVWYELAADWALKDPHGPSVVQDQVPAAHRPPQRVTNAGLLGWMLDQHAPLPGYSVHSGHLGANGDWVDSGPTPIARVAEGMAGSRPAAWEWYSPNRLALDYFASSAFADNEVARAQGLRLFHTGDIDIPLYAFQSDLTHGTVGSSARAVAAGTRIPSVDVATDESMTHLDILFADPAHNTFVRTAAAFLSRLPR
ncbi:alpha/beta hydrolase [Kitasatospora sp. NPDC088391]|uniref:alpha/beta hydrolase n=1 Tax=Kitasatospora sp. NPDC088391 TaxID=3364074 RepID=UPI0037F59EFE